MIRHNTESTPKRRRLPAPHRRELVISAATRTFAEHGYAGASIQQIAERAGVVASVVYDHFSSKRDLYLELLERHGRALIEHSVRSGPAETLEGLLSANIEAFYEVVEADPFVWRMIFRDPPPDPEAAEVHRDIQRRASAAIAEVIASVRPGEELIPGIPRQRTNLMLAEGIKATNNGLAAWWFEHRDVPRQQVVDLARTLLWAGLGRLVAASGGVGHAG